MVGVDQRLSPLQQTAATATDIWNDSCAVDELAYAIEHGAVGATANPTIVTDVWKQEPARWRDRVRALAAERREATERDLAWAVVNTKEFLKLQGLDKDAAAGLKLLNSLVEKWGKENEDEKK